MYPKSLDQTSPLHTSCIMQPEEEMHITACRSWKEYRWFLLLWMKIRMVISKLNEISSWANKFVFVFFATKKNLFITATMKWNKMMCCISVLACTVCNMCTACKQTIHFFLSLDEHDDNADGYSVSQERCPVVMFWYVQCTWFDIKNCLAKILSNIFRAWFSRTCSLVVIHIFNIFIMTQYATETYMHRGINFQWLFNVH